MAVRYAAYCRPVEPFRIVTMTTRTDATTAAFDMHASLLIARVQSRIPGCGGRCFL
jgi:hypothetical protein